MIDYVLDGITYKGRNLIEEDGVDDSLDFGMELLVDLKGVVPDRIKSRRTIEDFAGELVKEIQMKAYGAPLVPHFGHDDPNTSGYTLVQLIETSSITAHFRELKGKESAHVNVFSCQIFDWQETMHWIAEFWGATHVKFVVAWR